MSFQKKNHDTLIGDPPVLKSKFALLLIVLLIGRMGDLWSKEPSYGDEKAIREAKKKAIVKIIHEYSDGRKEEGTGTYVGKDIIITNYHVMRGYLEGEVKSTKILDWRGGAATSVSVGSCGGKNKDIDLCVLKVQGLDLHFPFKLYEREFRSSYNVIGFGYCMGRNDLTVWEGRVLNKIENTGETVRDYGSKINRNTQTYEVTIKNCPGSSGGAVFDPISGKLIALFSRYYFSGIDAKKGLDAIYENAKFTVITSIEIDSFIKIGDQFREIATEKLDKERYLRDPFMP